MKVQTLILAAVAAGILAGLLLIGQATILHRPPPSNPTVPVVSHGASASSEALQRCQQMAEPDDTCRALWAANRRHFLGLDQSSPSEREAQ